MKTEIERKFIVSGTAYKDLGTYEHCMQGYIPSTNDPLVRIRMIGSKSFLTMKSNINGLTRLEYEYQIPNQDAAELIKLFCKDSMVEKNRYIVVYKSTIWEVDEFLGDNAGLVVAEVELDTEDQFFNKPDWIKEEISTNKKYYNYNLAHHPYKKWNSIV